MIKLATVSPCYNEEAVLNRSVERLTALFKGMISDGLGLDFGVSYNTSAHSKTVLMFSMPLHNFFNDGYTIENNGTAYKPWEGINRRVGYITLTHRIRL